MKSHLQKEAKAPLKNIPFFRFIGSLGVGAIFASSSFAAEGENVRLQFSSSDNLILGIAALLGLVAVFFAFILAKGIQQQSKGSEGMQEVQSAIEDGAHAYLSQQIKMMIPFIGILAVGLVALYYGGLKLQAIFVALTFILGVISSYFSGYAGMIMAVKANARVAAAAMSSNKLALENAFKSGSVAGLVTVGVGLFFSSVILIVAPQIATVLLVGYGFGGSLAALFMRVGGGIYTKAADVGADLVGKVEQSIPEDSPKNPATIADNVGDNVGDCAGMAADVFESYEVMLVATIVLGAATSTILDGSVWPKLIVFALAACAVGIIASIIGISSVKGNDDLDSDPLKPILGGFRLSALISGVGTAVLAFVLLNNVEVRELATQASATSKTQLLINEIRLDLAKKKNVDKAAVTEREVLDDERAKKAGLSDKDIPTIQQVGMMTAEMLKETKGLEGFREVSQSEITGKSFPALNYAIRRGMDDPEAQKNPYTTISDQFSIKDAKKDQLVLVKLKLSGEQPGQAGQPAQKIDQDGWIGPAKAGDIDKQLSEGLKQMELQKVKVKIERLKEVKAKLFYNQREDKFAIIADSGVDRPDLVPGSQLAFYRKSVSEMQEAEKKQQADPKSGPGPEAVRIESACSVVLAKAEPWRFAVAVIFGILMSMGILVLTDYYVGANKRPVKEVAGIATTGPAPMMIQGFAYSLESAVFMVLAIVGALLVPLFLFPVATYGSMILSFYGIALVGLGMLTTTGYILAMDTFGPISDNAQGVFEMSGESHNEYGSTSLQRLDAAGNTTKAVTKGFAISTAVIAAVALFQSFVESSHLETVGLRLDVPEIFLGLLIGAAAPYLFSAFAINAVGRSAFALIQEVRRQFKEKPGILEGTEKPDYARCVALVTESAQRELIGPGILAICLPIAVGFGFSLLGGSATDQYNLKGAQALGGFLAGAIASGQLMAVLLANAGGMWDNAKKVIEDGMHGGKGTDAHKAAVVCDTVGDPFKDTAGPALNPLIKVMNLVALLVVGVIIQTSLPQIVRIAVTVISVGLLVFAFLKTKQGSLAESMAHVND